MTAAIRIDDLWKRYRIGARRPSTTFAEAWSGFGRRLLGSLQAASPYSAENEAAIWALREVSLEIQEGDIVGVIGRNGAGKSTLLKVLSRITQPTRGGVDLHGRVGSLLEVGTGFHPELTGRENIFLSGAILGMKRREIVRKFDEIVAFSEIEKFMDTPVKHYSSGMYTRLAFAVAAHLETDILLVDEVLAVGDAMFQRKCLGKMAEVGAQGRTTLFVSHNLQAISTLTHRCIVLDAGRCVCYGKTGEAIERYLEGQPVAEDTYVAPPSPDRPAITRVEVRPSGPNRTHQVWEPLEIRIRISTLRHLENAAVSFQIVNGVDQPVAYLWCFDSEQPIGREAGLHELVCRIPRARLYQGHYTLTVNFSENFGRRSASTVRNICPFEVVMHGVAHEFAWQPYACAYLEDASWRTNLIEPVAPGGDNTGAP